MDYESDLKRKEKKCELSKKEELIMIPLWLKIVWNGLGFFILLYLPYPISGLIVQALEQMEGGDLSKETEDKLRKAVNFGALLISLWILIFVLTMLYFKIPFEDWIG